MVSKPPILALSLSFSVLLPLSVLAQEMSPLPTATSATVPSTTPDTMTPAQQ